MTFPVHAQEESPSSEEAPVAESSEEETAEETPDPALTYAPDYCDFAITFPEAPYASKRCPRDQDACYDVTTYTMVYDLSTTVDVSVSCAPSTPDNMARYNERVMTAALEGMVKHKFIEDYNITYDERDTAKQATLTGTGQTGRQGKIYTGQIWVGPNSVFTLQAELIGAEHPEGDRVFKDILNSIAEKDGKQVPRPQRPGTNINR